MELPIKALEAAMQCMSEKSSSSGGNGSGGESAATLIDFFDVTARRCLLCDLPISTTHQAHLGRHEHQARLGVIERALAIINAFVLDFQRHENEKPRGGNRGSGSSENGSSSSPSTAFRRRSFAGLPFQPSTPASEKMLFRTSRSPKNLLGVDFSLLHQDASALRSIPFVEILSKKWWDALNDSYDLNAVIGTTPRNTFCRLSHLSSSFSKERRWRLRYLLDWLKYIGVLQSSLSIANANISPEAFSRSQRFELLEMVGDCVVKVELPDRLTRLFPHGVCSKLALFQRLIDSNSGLLDIYDWLALDQLIGAKLAHSKAKADVVECIFGELQCFLWATEVNSDPINVYEVDPRKEFHYLRAVVQHTMHELMHAVFMWRLEATLESSSSFIRAHALGLLSCQRRSTNHAKKRVLEKDIDRGRYSTLPLVTSEKRTHEMGHLSAGDLWYHSTHLAVTVAGAQQQAIRFLSSTPIVKPKVVTERLEAVNLLPFIENAAEFHQLMRSVKQKEEKTFVYFPSKCALCFPQWRKEEERQAEAQRFHDAIQDSLPNSSDVGAMLLNQFHELGNTFRRASPDRLPTQYSDSMAEDGKILSSTADAGLFMPDFSFTSKYRNTVEDGTLPMKEGEKWSPSDSVKELTHHILRGP